MTTEKEIIYNILNTARNEEHNIDEVLTERLLRSYLRTHRASLLRKYYADGHRYDDQVYQVITIDLKKEGDEYVAELPNIIRLNNNYGMYVDILGIRIPTLNSEQYYLSKNTEKIYGTSVGNKFRMRVNIGRCSCKNYNNDVKIFEYFYKAELKAKKENKLVENLIHKANLTAVLNNPDDDPLYDWENSVYPFPDELLDDLKMEILKKEINIMPHIRRDEIANARNDSLSNRTSNVSAQENA